MARAYSGVLGAIAMCLVIVHGLMTNLPPDEILSQGLVVFIGFAVLGFWIGNLAQKTVLESVEKRFREEMARMHAGSTHTNSDSTESRDQVGMATGRGTR